MLMVLKANEEKELEVIFLLTHLLLPYMKLDSIISLREMTKSQVT